jgi:hypothetical protein
MEVAQPAILGMRIMSAREWIVSDVRPIRSSTDVRRV